MAGSHFQALHIGFSSHIWHINTVPWLIYFFPFWSMKTFYNLYLLATFDQLKQNCVYVELMMLSDIFNTSWGRQLLVFQSNYFYLVVPAGGTKTGLFLIWECNRNSCLSLCYHQRVRWHRESARLSFVSTINLPKKRVSKLLTLTHLTIHLDLLALANATYYGLECTDPIRTCDKCNKSLSCMWF